jgi:hypothetical protein
MSNLFWLSDEAWAVIETPTVSLSHCPATHCQNRCNHQPASEYPQNKACASMLAFSSASMMT